MIKKQFIRISPLLSMLVSTVTIRIAAGLMGIREWLPWALVYWLIVGGLAIGAGEREATNP